MRAPLSWLRDFASFPEDVGLLRETLDDLGLVVEDVEIVGEGLDDVVVARIDEISAIEGADRVRRVVVDAGAGPVEIVCGATNFALGDLVPLAPVGAILPGGFEIARRKMRGVVSNGMLCSGRELELGDDHEGLLLLTETPGAIPGAALVEVLGIERDVIFDVTVEGNRPDAWCISGIARDLAARLGLEFSVPTSPSPTERGPDASTSVTAEVVDADLCGRLAVSVLTDVTVTDSPPWIQERLRRAGMRPINNVVDASNYVMLELGQPTHPYDLEKVHGPGLRVRRARPGESLITLDGVTRELGKAGRGLGDTGEDCVICDADDVVIGIAGIMGGGTSEISGATTSVLLEAASFDPIAITRTSRRLALRTEAAARFSKGSDPAILEEAIERFAALVALSAPKVVVAASPVIVPSAGIERDRLALSIERVNATLGTELDAVAIGSLLTPLGFDVVDEGAGSLTIGIPMNRPDIRRTHHGAADLIEEIARIYGYSRIPRRAMAWPAPGRPSDRQRLRAALRDVLCGLGASEAWTPSLVAPGDLALLGRDEPEIVVTNPLTHDESRLRRSLLPGLVRAIGYNVDRRQEDLALFEIGAVFVHPDVDREGRSARAGSAGGSEVLLPKEPEMAVAIFARASDDARTALGAAHAVADALGLVDLRLDASSPVPGLHPTRSAILVDRTTGARLGQVGEVDPGLVEVLASGAGERRLGYVELDLDVLADASRATRRDPAARPVSRFPSSDFDLAFVLADGVQADRLLDVVGEAAGDLLEDIRLFDVYRGPGLPEASRSLAVRVRLCAEDRTLSEDELGQARSAMIEAAGAINAALR